MFYTGLTLGIVVFTALVSILVVMGMLTGENWCGDRWPWWGPPEDPSSTCSGHWASRHPGDYPWQLRK